ncbi:class I SAM-dependent methyltransferase [Actinosynnema sp. NPDC047251]|uniref:Methyltransferase type 11 n=1 Tax=Saccharothrix espanaensis (strain ATCC 51144 / DSM 44229 / JCM 9112 / NBRC 15066 / NRRL 15764) TaxID=1179773 RepID=K0K7M2_SACES|nr:class I SAM-dependent methyltransferase [Saccharothrix espanaensis]CCH34381.1 Methyltransferase type 11 [Saccharothrix espanaensis DSM 44229]
MSDFTAPPVDPSNTGQLDAWDGDQGDLWIDQADRLERGLARYHPGFLAAAAPTPVSDVLDVGCGGGRTTLDAARRARSALGVDLSSRMIDRARAQAAREGLANAAFEQADAQIHPFPDAAFDVVISRFGAMFFGDPVAAFGNLARALRPGGRVVLLTWQDFRRNEFFDGFRTLLAGGRDLPDPPTDTPSPFALSEPDRVRRVLTEAGLADVRLTSLTEQMYLGRDVEDAFGYVTLRHESQIRDLPPEAVPGALEAVRASLAEHVTPEGVRYGSAVWLVEARKP